MIPRSVMTSAMMMTNRPSSSTARCHCALTPLYQKPNCPRPCYQRTQWLNLPHHHRHLTPPHWHHLSELFFIDPQRHPHGNRDLGRPSTRGSLPYRICPVQQSSEGLQTYSQYPRHHRLPLWRFLENSLGWDLAVSGEQGCGQRY